MINKDYLFAEIEKLAKVLARIIGLKNKGDVDEAIQISHSTLKEDFGIDPAQLPNFSTKEFEEYIKSKDFPTQKLDLLAQFLFESVYPFDESSETPEILHKVLVIYNIIEKDHHTLSMENFSKREMIDNYLNTNQYE